MSPEDARAYERARRIWLTIGLVLTTGLMVFGAYYFLTGEYARAACFLLLVMLVDERSRRAVG